MQRKTRGGACWVCLQEQTQEAIEMRHVADDQNGPALAGQLVAEPGRGTVRLQSARRWERRQRVARPPEQLRGLTRAELSAVPHLIWPHASAGGLRRKPRCSSAPGIGQGPHRIDVRTDRL